MLGHIIATVTLLRHAVAVATLLGGYIHMPCRCQHTPCRQRCHAAAAVAAAAAAAKATCITRARYAMLLLRCALQRLIIHIDPTAFEMTGNVRDWRELDPLIRKLRDITPIIHTDRCRCGSGFWMLWPQWGQKYLVGTDLTIHVLSDDYENMEVNELQKISVWGFDRKYHRWQRGAGQSRIWKIWYCRVWIFLQM